MDWDSWYGTNSLESDMEELKRQLAEGIENNAALCEVLARYQRKLGRARAALREAIAVAEAGTLNEFSTMQVQGWKAALEFDGKVLS